MNDLPVGAWHWLVAVLPLGLLLVLLTMRGWKAPQAGPVGALLGAATAVLVFRTSVDGLAVAVGTGVWDAVFILYVVWPALLLYRVVDAAGGFAALREGIRGFSRNQLFLVLSFGWVFASFLQGITGFGTPIAVVAPLLVAIGVRPVLAVVIPLIGHAWANLFGTLAVAWLATLRVVDLEDQATTAWQTALLLWIPNLAGGLAIAWLFGRGQAVRHALPFVLVISVIHGGGQLALVFVTPVLSAFLASVVAVLALYPLSRWRRYSEATEEIEDRPAMRSEARQEDQPRPVMSFAWSLLPYLALTVGAVGMLALPPVERVLAAFEVGVGFPRVETGYGVVTEAADPYSPFSPLTHPGTVLLLAALVAWAVYRARGFYRQWQERVGKQRILAGTAGDAVPASIAIVTFLVLAKTLDVSGQVDVLALGIAAVAPAAVYAVLANVIGALGSFMTSSNTASNVLFGQLQQTVAGTEGLSESAIIAAQNAGGAIGNSVSPANVVLGTTTAGIVGQEGAVLRRTLPWAGTVVVLTGLATLLLL